MEVGDHPTSLNDSAFQTVGHFQEREVALARSLLLQPSPQAVEPLGGQRNVCGECDGLVSAHDV